MCRYPLFFVVVGSIFSLSCSSRPREARHQPSEPSAQRPDDAAGSIEAAKAAFKAKSQGKFRPAEAVLLYPLISKGMTPAQVRDILGEPDEKHSTDRNWFYTVGYSQAIGIDFENGKVADKQAVGLEIK